MVRSAVEPRELLGQKAASALGQIFVRERARALVNIVEPNYNGFTFGCKSFEGLVSLMLWMGAMGDPCLDGMLCGGDLASHRTSPDRLTWTLLQHQPNRRGDRRQSG